MAGARRDVRRAPVVSRQPACKPGSGWHADTIRMRDGHSSWAPVARHLQRPTRTAGSGHRSRDAAYFRAQGFAPSLFGLAPGGVCRAAGVAAGAVRSYRTVSPLPRLLRNAPRRFVLCGTVPRLAPAGRYPAPFVHGARTFLPGNLSVLPERPSGRLTKRGMEAAVFAVKRRRAARYRGRAPPRSSLGRDGRAGPATSRAWIDRRRRRLAPGENDAGTRSPRRASPNRNCR